MFAYQPSCRLCAHMSKLDTSVSESGKWIPTWGRVNSERTTPKNNRSTERGKQGVLCHRIRHTIILNWAPWFSFLHPIGPTAIHQDRRSFKQIASVTMVITGNSRLLMPNMPITLWYVTPSLSYPEYFLSPPLFLVFIIVSIPHASPLNHFSFSLSVSCYSEHPLKHCDLSSCDWNWGLGMIELFQW